jgi:hypothetical protein
VLKIILAFIPCWLGYAVGSLASRLIVWSSELQDWAGGAKGFPWEVWADLPDDGQMSLFED